MRRRRTASGSPPASGGVPAPAPMGIHAHPHRHAEDAQPHAHPHHHRLDEAPAAHPRAEAVPLVHDHGHGLSFERYTYLCSPVHTLDPRVKILSVLALVLVVVLSGPPRAPELVGVAALLLAATLLAGVPVGFVLKRSALVVPFAGTIALFAPLAQGGGSLSVAGLAGSYAGGGWVVAYAIIAKAWLATLAVVVLSTTTPVPRLFKGLERLRVPDVMLMMLSFMYRYAEVMRRQLTALRTALDSRGFGLTPFGRVRLYGGLAGAMFIRAYERGERVHQAMRSRGYDGTLPSVDDLRLGPGDALVVVTMAAALWALVLY